MNMNRLPRIWRHLNTGDAAMRRAFPKHAIQAIEDAVRDSESKHAGEIRFAVEGALSLGELWRGVTPRERAIEVFSRLRVWDTEHNNGVLIYVLLADHDVEIVADRGVAGGHVTQEEWERCCKVMEQHFRDGNFRDGAILGVQAVAEVLARRPPERPDAGNELPDRPAVL